MKSNFAIKGQFLSIQASQLNLLNPEINEHVYIWETMRKRWKSPDTIRPSLKPPPNCLLIRKSFSRQTELLFLNRESMFTWPHVIHHYWKPAISATLQERVPLEHMSVSENRWESKTKNEVSNSALLEMPIEKKIHIHRQNGNKKVVLEKMCSILFTSCTICQ